MSTSTGSNSSPGTARPRPVRIPAGIAISDGAVQIAYPRRRGRRSSWSVATCFLAPPDSESVDQAGRRLGNLARRARIPRGSAICALSSGAIDIFPLTLRRRGEESLDGLVVAQAREQLNYPLEESVIDFAVLPAQHVRGGSETTVVLTFAIRKDLANTIVRLCDRAGLTAVRIMTPACALAPHLACSSPGARQLLIATAETATSISVIQDGQVLLERFLGWSVERLIARIHAELDLPDEQCRALLTGEPRRGALAATESGADGDTDPLAAALEEILGPSFQELADETTGCVGYCDSFLQHQEISAAVLTGPLAGQSHLRRFLRRSLDLPLGDPGASFEFAEWENHTDASIFATAAGCALWSTELASPPAAWPQELAA